MHSGGPGRNELEISLFGPGYGESIVIHLGNGDWMIVDSCIDKESQQPCALQYLKSIGVDYSTQVKVIVATHWHDDHIRGLEEIYRACTKAAFFISNALRSKEFIEISKAYSRRSGMASSGANTIAAIFERGVKRSQLGFTFGYAINNRVLMEVPASSSSQGYKITALSPSDELCTKAFAAFQQKKPKAGNPKLRLSSPTQNDTAVVLWVQAGNKNFLLGADLEEPSLSNGAWSLIVQNPNNFDKTGAEIFKIPHHGSSNGNCNAVWEKMLSSKPHALITPYTRLKHPLPTKDDLDRIKKQAHKVHITHPGKSSSKRLPLRGALNKMISKSTKNFHPVPMATGHICLTTDLTKAADWKVTHFGTAYEV